MTENEFFNIIGANKKDALAIFLNILNSQKADYCVIGGLAVNSYAEPVVSLDLDIVVLVDKIEQILIEAANFFTIEQCQHSINLNSDQSNVRIQLQSDPRYQDFISRAQTAKVLGYSMRVAALEDVLQGKLWAYGDTTRRPSKRQKDLADILRLVETHADLIDFLPEEIRKKLL
ncbi:MAG: hypothetical protein JW841_10455 [Deltaproteobacteria bacterium]|nr:hypothetical protein [Deltaproteobacteria bacterium]